MFGEPNARLISIIMIRWISRAEYRTPSRNGDRVHAGHPLNLLSITHCSEPQSRTPFHVSQSSPCSHRHSPYCHRLDLYKRGCHVTTFSHSPKYLLKVDWSLPFKTPRRSRPRQSTGPNEGSSASGQILLKLE